MSGFLAPSPGLLAPEDRERIEGFLAASAPQRPTPQQRLAQFMDFDTPSLARDTLMGFTAGPASVAGGADAGIAALREGLLARNPGLRLWMAPTGSGHLRLSEIVVPAEQRGQGVGSRVMQEITDYADANGMPVALSPDGAFGGSVRRLKEFYGRLGFRPNTGRSRDLSISETMIRPPVGAP
jgi:GNAT superfamily N-acetyltransferase